MSYYRFAERLAPLVRGVAQGGEFGPLVLKQTNKQKLKTNTYNTSPSKKKNKKTNHQV